MKIIVTEKIAQEGIDYLLEKGFEVDCKFGLTQEQLAEIIANYDAIIVRSATKVDKAIIEAGVNLKVAGRAGNGIDNIDVKSCTQKGIIVVNTPESNIMAAAELAVALAYSIFRNIPQANHAGKYERDFRRNRFNGNELDGKVAGLIGLGKIGTIVARKLIGNNMKVMAFDSYIPDEHFKMLGVERANSLEEILQKSDLISFHTPKTAETYGMIGAKELAMCKRGVRIVNAARGGLVNEDALYDALESGQVAAAALDVLDPEPNYGKSPEEQDYKNKLLELENLIITPHLGASTSEATLNVGTEVAKLVGDALNGEMVAAVNMPPIKGGNLGDLKPYIDLAEFLGKIYYQTEKETVKRLEIIYSGDLAEKETKVISLSVIKGFLEPQVKEMVNYVNAEMMLSARGIEMIESKTTQLDKYTNLITVNFVTNTQTLSVSGTVFGKDSIRIVDFFGYKMDFEPSKYILALQNIDQPGIIGSVGTLLGDLGINIAAMQWSSRGDKAVSFVSVDEDVSNEVLEKLKAKAGILKASKLKF